MVFFTNFADGEKIAQRLGHLFPVNIDESVMYPVTNRLFPRATAGLRDFVFVMRKDQVFAAAVDIEGVAEVFFAHGRTFNMPARSARTPGAFPKRFTGLALFP